VRDFFAMIDRMNGAAAAERAALESQLTATYQCDKAVLALDMSGFSLTVRRSGIVSYLCCIRRMQQLMRPLLPKFGGELVKFEADNLLAVFDDPDRAVAAAIAMNQVATSAEVAPGQAPLAVGIGLDYGPILLVPGQDCYGDAVNIAYKLGEDVARPGEILLTQTLSERLFRHAGLEPLDLTIAGMRIPAYRVRA
jgi:adenylate cyclase